MRTTNRSRFRMISSGMCTVHGNDRVTQLCVISGHSIPVFHADFFPRLVKYDVTSQPVNMKEQHSFGKLTTYCRGNLMDRDVFELLTSSECYPQLLNVW